MLLAMRTKEAQSHIDKKEKKSQEDSKRKQDTKIKFDKSFFRFSLPWIFNFCFSILPACIFSS